jgi:predicted DNA-binding transcriptional regulator YafY
MFNDDEALALTLGLWFTRRLGIAGVVKSTETAIAKMERVMPASLRDHIHMLESTLVMDSPLPRSVSSEVIMTLSRAIYEHKQTRLHYRTRDSRASERVIDPYGLIHRFGLWYVAGYCHLREDLRLFRIDRIERLALLVNHFTRPRMFDLLRCGYTVTHPSIWLTEVWWIPRWKRHKVCPLRWRCSTRVINYHVLLC